MVLSLLRLFDGQGAKGSLGQSSNVPAAGVTLELGSQGISAMIINPIGPRFRMILDLRDSSADGSQRGLNALEPGTVIMEVKDGAYEPLGEGDVLK